jgi:hypothetical protein
MEVDMTERERQEALAVEARRRIAEAIARTVEHVPGHFEMTLASRQPGGTGSVFRSRTSRKDLERAEWLRYDSPHVAPGCVSFVTYDLPGHLGVVPLADVPCGQRVRFEDPKGTGFPSVVTTVRGPVGPSVGSTTIILGDRHGREVVYTFHPGDPIPPSRIPTAACPVEGEHDAALAWAIGFRWAKIHLEPALI